MGVCGEVYRITQGEGVCSRRVELVDELVGVRQSDRVAQIAVSRDCQRRGQRKGVRQIEVEAIDFRFSDRDGFSVIATQVLNVGVNITDRSRVKVSVQDQAKRLGLSQREGVAVAEGVNRVGAERIKDIDVVDQVDVDVTRRGIVGDGQAISG